MNKKQLIVAWVTKILGGVAVGLILYGLGITQGARNQAKGDSNQVTSEGDNYKNVFHIQNFNYSQETEKYKIVYVEEATQDTVTLVSGTVKILPIEFKKPLDQFLIDNDILSEVLE